MSWLASSFPPTRTGEVSVIVVCPRAGIDSGRHSQESTSVVVTIANFVNIVNDVNVVKVLNFVKVGKLVNVVDDAAAVVVAASIHCGSS